MFAQEQLAIAIALCAYFYIKEMASLSTAATEAQENLGKYCKME